MFKAIHTFKAKISFHIHDFAYHFKTDNKAVAAVEFALVLPVLVAIYLSTVEITQAITAQRKVAIAAGTISDLTAQYESMNQNDISMILAASNAIMGPFKSGSVGTGDLTARILSIKIDGGGTASIDWARSKTMGWMLPDDTNDDSGSAEAAAILAKLPNDLKTPDTSVIAAEVQYNYISPFQFLPGITSSDQARPLTQLSFFRPRLVSSIPFQGSTPSAAWPVPTSGSTAGAPHPSYVGYGPEYMLEPREVQRTTAAYDNPPSDLNNAWNCETSDPACNPGSAPYGGGGWDEGGGGGGGGGCNAYLVKIPSQEIYNVAYPQCRHIEPTQRPSQ